MFFFNRYARRLDLSDSSSCDEQESHISSYYKGNRQLPVISPAILSDFSNNGVVPFLLNAEKSHSSLIAMTLNKRKKGVEISSARFMGVVVFVTALLPGVVVFVFAKFQRDLSTFKSFDLTVYLTIIPRARMGSE